VILVDGKAESTIAADDLAVTGGHGVFETMRTYKGRVFRADLHLARLRDSAAWCGIAMPNFGTLAAEMEAAKSDVEGEAYVNIVLTGSGRRVVRAQPLQGGRAGMPIRLASAERHLPPWLPGWVKHTSRLGWTLATQQAQVDEMLWIAPDGTWTEGSRSNIIVVRQGVASTPPDDGRILRGITRATLLEAAADADLPLVEAPVRARACDEMYVVSTLKELAPVASLDGKDMPGWGPVGRELARALATRIRQLTAG
jgi:branched-subunit amino acid aminotransferase/4-amino-4-deoxychorismate lyase